MIHGHYVAGKSNTVCPAVLKSFFKNTQLPHLPEHARVQNGTGLSGGSGGWDSFGQGCVMALMFLYLVIEVFIVLIQVHSVMMMIMKGKKLLATCVKN